MNVFKELKEIKKPHLLTLINKETGLDAEYVILRPDGKITKTSSETIDTKGLTKAEKTFYLSMKTDLMFTSVFGVRTGRRLKETLKNLKEHCKNNGLELVVISDIEEVPVE